MSELKGTQTEKNILTAFAGESQARNRYTYYASQAKKEGYVQISAVFEETANQEKAHAKRLFKFLEGGDVEVVAAFPAGVIGTTEENLRAAAAGEHEEQAEMYPAFAKTAEEEGFNLIAGVFRAIGVAERGRGRFRSFLLKSLQNFLSSEARKTMALKRGGKRPPLPLDFADGEDRYAREPAHEFDPGPGLGVDTARYELQVLVVARHERILALIKG